jgi:hypothetical protein
MVKRNNHGDTERTEVHGVLDLEVFSRKGAKDAKLNH